MFYAMRFIDWLLTQIFDGFKIDVSYMTDEEYATCMTDTFNKLEYRNISESKLTGEKWMGGFYKLLSKEQRKNLIGLYEDLFEKSIEIVNKKMIIVDKTR